MSITSIREKVAQVLAPLHVSVKAEEIGTHPVDGGGNPVGSISERNHKVAEKSRILNALRKRAKLNADDMALARQLGINVGTDHKDPNLFDL